jgi:hypothetical protein
VRTRPECGAVVYAPPVTAALVLLLAGAYVRSSPAVRSQLYDSSDRWSYPPPIAFRAPQKPP